jgi:IS5 family transposase
MPLVLRDNMGRHGCSGCHRRGGERADHDRNSYNDANSGRRQTLGNFQFSEWPTRNLPGFGVMKRVFGFAQVRYRGLEKNAHRLFVTCALVNLFIVRKRLLHA